MVKQICVAGFLSLWSSGVFADPSPVTIEISTSLGEIIVVLDARRAPRTVENFLRYVDDQVYDGGAFHRTVTLQNQPDHPVKIEVIQAAVAPSGKEQELLPVALERTSITGLTHRSGTLSMARGEPDSATSHFFICVSDQPELDFGGRRSPDGQGFAAFGRVVKGMDVVRKIHQFPAEGQRLTPPIAIRAVRRATTSGTFNTPGPP